MITREEAIQELWMMYPSKFSFNKAEGILHKVFNDFEQHIKYLEAQIPNTEQLTCDGCKNLSKYGCTVVSLCLRNPRIKNLHADIQNTAMDNYIPKDTQ